MKAELHNDAIRNIAMPKTVADMYHHAAKYVTPRKETKSSYGAAFTSVSEGKRKPRGYGKRSSRDGGNPSSTEERLLALEEKMNKEYTALVGKEEPKPKVTFKQEDTSSTATRTYSGSGGGKKKYVPHVECWTCGLRGHYESNCPDLQTSESGDEESSDGEDS
jgi:hypothetical protein